MHIEPSVVSGAKLALSYATAAGSLGLATKLAYDTIKNDAGLTPFIVQSIATTALVFSFFEVFPHHPIGVSEVHLILGSTLFLIFGAGPTAVGLTLGLLAQSIFFAPTDLPQFGMNITSLLVPLFAMKMVASRIIPKNIAYKDVQYGQALALSAIYQGGIVTWVAFWAIYGLGFTTENLAQIFSFGTTYMLVIVVEPLIDLSILALAKKGHKFKASKMLNTRLYQPEYS